MENSGNHLEQLREIRSMMERSSRFLSLSGLAGVSAGLAALAGAAVAWYGLHFTQRHFDRQEYFGTIRPGLAHPFLFLIIDALAVLALALILSIFFTTRNARRKGLKVWDSTTRHLIISLLIPLVTGGLFCIVLIYHGLIYLVAPATLIFYGLALISAGKYTFTEVRYLGAAEVLLGLLASVFVGYGLLFWTVGFGLFHIIYGIRAWIKYER